MAAKIKYLVINGDLIDGIGVYPKQKEDLVILDLFHQFKKASDLLSEIPDYTSQATKFHCSDFNVQTSAFVFLPPDTKAEV